jgi:hypothetical protein
MIGLKEDAWNYGMDVRRIFRRLLAEPAFSSENCATNRRLLAEPIN